jgi:hypothetical protein
MIALPHRSPFCHFDPLNSGEKSYTPGYSHLQSVDAKRIRFLRTVERTCFLCFYTICHCGERSEEATSLVYMAPSYWRLCNGDEFASQPLADRNDMVGVEASVRFGVVQMSGQADG